MLCVQGLVSMENKMLTMDLGEVRECIIEISSNNDEVFTIRNATYVFTKDDETISTGDCTIKDHELYAVIEPTSAGVHRLIYTYEIGNERLIDKIWINVKG